MKYERPAVLATYKVEELMKDAAVCTRYGQENRHAASASVLRQLTHGLISASRGSS